MNLKILSMNLLVEQRKLVSFDDKMPLISPQTQTFLAIFSVDDLHTFDAPDIARNFYNFRVG